MGIIINDTPTGKSFRGITPYDV